MIGVEGQERERMLVKMTQLRSTQVNLQTDKKKLEDEVGSMRKERDV